MLSFPKLAKSDDIVHPKPQKGVKNSKFYKIKKSLIVFRVYISDNLNQHINMHNMGVFPLNITM